MKLSSDRFGVGYRQYYVYQVGEDWSMPCWDANHQWYMESYIKEGLLYARLSWESPAEGKVLVGLYQNGRLLSLQLALAGSDETTACLCLDVASFSGNCQLRAFFLDQAVQPRFLALGTELSF